MYLQAAAKVLPLAPALAPRLARSASIYIKASVSAFLRKRISVPPTTTVAGAVSLSYFRDALPQVVPAKVAELRGYQVHSVLAIVSVVGFCCSKNSI